MTLFNEDTVEQAALDWLCSLNYTALHGESIAPGEPAAERTPYGEAFLLKRLRDALHRLNIHIPSAVRSEVIEEAIPCWLLSSSTHNLAHALRRNAEFAGKIGDGFAC